MGQIEHLLHSATAAIDGITVPEILPLTPNEVNSHIDSHELDGEHETESEADDL